MNIIHTLRLTLVSLPLEFIQAAEAGGATSANTILGAEYPPELLAYKTLYTYRRKQLEADPNVQPWLLRAIFLKDTNTVIGRIGFHDARF